jgi:hypothetical protein
MVARDNRAQIFHGRTVSECCDSRCPNVEIGILKAAHQNGVDSVFELHRCRWRDRTKGRLADARIRIID